MLAGVDASSFQGMPTQWRAAAGDIDFAAVKLTEVMPDGSRYTDPDAAADWEFLKAAGKGRIAYLFGHPASSANDTAMFFVSVLNQIGLDDGDAVALDFETTDSRNPAQCSVWARMVLRQLESALQRKPLVYSYLAFAQAGNCSGLGSYPLWISDPDSPPGQPRVPAPWTGWALHQTGITSPIDHDVAAFASLDAMRAALGKKGVPVPAAANYTTSGTESLQQVAVAAKTAPSTILRMTAVAGGKFAPDLAEFLDGVFGGSVPPSSPLPCGLVLKVPA